MGVAVDRTELKDLLADGIEQALAQLVAGVLVEAVRVVDLIQRGAGFVAQGQHLFAGKRRKNLGDHQPGLVPVEGLEVL